MRIDKAVVVRFVALSVVLVFLTAAATRADPMGTAQAQAAKMNFKPAIIYSVKAGVVLRLDAWYPTGSGHPAVVVIHGGGWRSGGRAEMISEAQSLASSGFAAFSIDYRLAPPGGNFQAGAASDDVHTAVQWVRTNAVEYGVDATRVGALGSSAGGHLAMMAATTGTKGADRVDAAVSWSGPTDLPALGITTLAGGRALNYIGCPQTTCPQNWLENSPYDQVSAATSPIYLANSTNEIIPLSQATLMVTKLQQFGVPYTLKVLQGHEHADAYESQVLTESINFLSADLGRH